MMEKVYTTVRLELGAVKLTVWYSCFVLVTIGLKPSGAKVGPSGSHDM